MKKSAPNLKIWILTGIGFGFSPWAPGSVGSLWGPIIVALIPANDWYVPMLTLAVGILFIPGILFHADGEQYFGRKDPGSIVLDEIAAYPLVHLFVPIDWVTGLMGFVLFRLFDIVKPWPIRQVEKLPAGWGVMLDDIVAAIYAMLVLTLFVKAF